MQGYVLECLQCLHEPIPLPDNTPVRLGRSPQTQITEPRCSRLQLEVQVSWSTGEIQVTQLGANISSIDGRDLIRGQTVIMDPSSTLFILKGMFPHKVVLKGDKPQAQPTDKKSPEAFGNPNKRKAEPSEHRVPHKKHRREDDREEGINVAQSLLSSSNNIVTPNRSDRLPVCKQNEVIKSDRPSNTSLCSYDGDKKGARQRDLSSNIEDTLKRRPDEHDNSKKSEHSMSDTKEEDSETQVKAVVEKLRQLQNQVKMSKQPNGSCPSTSVHCSIKEDKKSPKPLAEQDRKAKTSACSSKSKTLRTAKVLTPAAQSAWHIADSEEKLFVFISKGLVSREKIAGFDIDGTIITTQSGNVFPKDTADWKLTMSEIVGKLKHLVAAGYKIVFFTNQLRVTQGKVKIKDLQEKFENVQAKLQVPIQIFVSTSRGLYRKPAMGMWQVLKKQWNDGVPVNTADSFYVGDAAGRPEKWAPKKKKDFSCSDRLFALNIGIKFFTPEEYFLGQKAAPFTLPDFDPRAIRTDGPLLAGGEQLVGDDVPEVIVLVGFQASGKSTFAKKYLVPKGYHYVNQDRLKSWSKCVSECKKMLSAGKSVVIDNTNIDTESRARYIDCARNAGRPCQCFFFDLPLSHCRHNEMYREISDKEHKPINEIIFNSSKSKFKAPEVSEGFSRVVKVNFVGQFLNRVHEKIYRQFLLEK